MNVKKHATNFLRRLVASAFTAAFAAAFAFAAPCSASAQTSQAGLSAQAAQEARSGVSHSILPNGLEVFVVPNHSVPLVTVSVVIRGGAIAQTPETAGLFHLYEHMLFVGNSKFPTKEAFSAALYDMGTTSWNGATGTEKINYYITIPSDRLGEGVDFWAQAIRNPVFDPAKLENEKQVVINEIRGYYSEPANIAENALQSRIFTEYPWRKNIEGPEKNVRNATVGMLRDMQAKYYIPRNMALMIGGDCDAARALELARESFGDWEGGPSPELGEPPQGPIPSDVRLIADEDLFYKGLAFAQFWWRGPDVLRQAKDTYASDVLIYLLSSPVGRFKTSIMEKVPGLYDPEYINFSYLTVRDGGVYSLSAYMLVRDPSREGAVLDRVEALRAAVADEFALVAADPEGYFGEGELEKAKTKLIDENIYAMESSQSFVTDTLPFWWGTATADYFFAYQENCGAVGWGDVADLARRYIVGGGEAAPSMAVSGAKAPNVATIVRIKSVTAASDEAMDDRMKKYGYESVNADNAYWWQK